MDTRVRTGRNRKGTKPYTTDASMAVQLLVSRPKGAFYFVVDFPVDDAEKFSIFMLRDFQWEGCTVMFAPAEDFYVTKNLGRTQARIAYVLNEEELKMAVRCLEEGLKAYRRKCCIQ